MTVTVDRTVIATIGPHIGLSTGQDSKRPTAAGMNISGMISTKKICRILDRR